MWRYCRLHCYPACLLPCVLSSCVIVILSETKDLYLFFLDASLRSSMTNALHANDKNNYRHYFIMRR